MRRLLALGLLIAAACSNGQGDRVVGLVVEVDGDLASVDRFTVLVEGGERMVFHPSEDGDYDFPLVHLRDHLRSGEPVEVTYVEQGGRLVAVGLADG